MAIVLPRNVQIQVREAVYRKADEFGYMHKSRVDSGTFMDRLVRDREVGSVLAQWMGKDSIKTYIKDGILNRYMKDKKKVVLSSGPERLLPVVREAYQQEAQLIEGANSTFLFRLENNDIVLVAQGTFLKWETALRKALVLIEKAPGLPPEGVKLHIVLNIALLGHPSTRADRDHLKNALAYLGVELNFAD